MKIAFTKSKSKLIFAGILLLITALCFVAAPLFVLKFSKWIVLPVTFFLEATVFFFLLFDIQYNYKLNQILTALMIFVLPVISFECIEILQKSFLVSSIKAFIINYLLYFAVFLLFSILTTQIKYSSFVLSPIFLLTGLINHYVLAFRGTPMQPWDIAAAKTAMNVVDNFIFTVDEYVIFSVLLTIIFICITASLKKINYTTKTFLYAAGISIIAIVLCVTVSWNTILGNRGKFDRDLWNQTVSSQKNGYAVNFLLNLQLMSNTAPEGYSVENVNNILASYTNDDQIQKKPNIIVIMNEALADLATVDDIGLNEYYLPFINSLKNQNNTVTGTLNVSVFGGGTCNTEYEFLTSNVCSMLRAGSYPMQQFVNTESVSIASNLKKLGYKTVGLHPYYGSGWNRSRSYPLLGFDEFITIDDFDDSTEMIREYVSDRACYDRIIQVTEQSTDQPLFLFAVTMQNHGGYETAWDDMPDNVSFKNEENYPQTDRYMELAKLSDDAVKELITYFDNNGTDTIILLFGDHQPSLGAEYEQLFTSTVTSKLEGATKKYTVPFFIWSNFEIEKESIQSISPNYLAPLLLEKAKLPQTAYYKYLNDLREEIPSITTMAYQDKSGKLFDANEPKGSEAELIQQYDILQYNNVFDKDHLVTEKFSFTE